MARPRQRRKVKNVSQKVTRKQRNPNNISFAGAPALVQKHWNKKLTLRENYAKMGLLASLDGTAGGEENPLVNRTMSELAELEQAVEDNDDDVDMESSDEDDEEFPLENVVKYPTSNIGSKVQSITRPGRKVPKLNIKKVSGKSEIIKELEEMAKNEVKLERRASENEQRWMTDLINKYGEDYDAMTRDLKLNPYQLTKSQLKKKIEGRLKK
ncbi:Nucleolar protein 16 [Nowakowskiella sp. JEL0407]|nr:Nucleolar protein 16 [Nowakowskiella sp. JEL0407]